MIDSFVFSSPAKIVRCFWSMVLDRSIFLHLGITLYETILSFLFVTGISILIAVIFVVQQKIIRNTGSLSGRVEQSSEIRPGTASYRLAREQNQTTIIIAGMSVAIFGSILNLYTSFTTIDEEKIKLIYTLHGTRHHALTKVVLPSSIPAIISNMKVNIGLCLVGVIIGEFLAARNGLGYLIIYSSQVFKMDWLLMSIVLLCIMAMGLYALINLVEKLCKNGFKKSGKADPVFTSSTFPDTFYDKYFFSIFHSPMCFKTW